MARKSPPPPPSRKRPPPIHRAAQWDATVYEPLVKVTEKSGRGCALALVAYLQQALSGKPRRLYWCLDLHRDMGVPKANPVASPEYEVFMETMKRFRATVDYSPDIHKAQCQIGLILRHTITTQMAGMTEVLSSFNVPWKGDLTLLGTSDPVVGVWRLWPVEPFKPNHDNLLGLPETFWVDGIPF